MQQLKIFLFLAFIAPLCSAGGPIAYHKGVPGFNEAKSTGGKLLPRVDINDRLNCSNGEPTEDVPGRANTTAQVSDLIPLITLNGAQAYIIPSEDAHNSEYVADADKRRAFISGFTGSAGTAVVLADGQRALWTDGRYFLAADEEMDCNWILMKDGEPGVPSIVEWLEQELTNGDVVLADPRLLTSSRWQSARSDFLSYGLTLEVETIGADGFNIVDDVWANYGRPAYPTDPIWVHPMSFAGQTWESKVDDIVVDMNAQGAEVYVVSMLDEVAWFLNLRGNDIPYNPVFRSYVIVDTRASLPDVLWFVSAVPDERVDAEVRDHLNIDQGCTTACATMYDYDQIGTILGLLSNDASVTKILIPESASYYLYDLVESGKREVVDSPVMLRKAYKNDIEQAGMRNAHIKDATALYQFMTFFENEMVNTNNRYTEIEAMNILDDFRLLQPDNVGLSFATISAFGANAAIIHYGPTPETDTLITKQGVYMLDSGGQYLDGTTDVTRTFHFGTPEPKEIEAYTSVLKGQIAFATAIFPAGEWEYYIDYAARRDLYNRGLDYRHGTSHGIGICLYVHEASSHYFELGNTYSDEPGYYEDGFFGIRLENVVMVVNKTTPYDFTEYSHGFDTLTLFHYEQNLIDVSLLTTAECQWLSDHYDNIINIMGPHLTAEGLTAEYDYMISKTQPIC